MPDLLAHALLAYTLCTLLALRYEWLSPAYVTVGMAGAFVPDLAKLDLFVDSTAIAATLDVPFEWFGLHTLGGSVVALLVGTTLVTSGDRRRVSALLALGALSHLAADALLLKASGRSNPMLWPLTTYAPPTPGLYLSTDVWPSAAAAGVAGLAWFVVRYRRPARTG